MAGLPVPKLERVQNLLKLEDFLLQLQLVRTNITVNFAKQVINHKPKAGPRGFEPKRGSSPTPHQGSGSVEPVQRW
jgi:hypothetical protein